MTLATSEEPIARLTLLDDIVPDPSQPRKRFLQEPLQELADNIWSQGLIQPITVTADAAGGPSRIFVGERRWRVFVMLRERARLAFESAEELPDAHPAHRYEHWTRIPTILEQPMAPHDRLMRQLDENDQRSDLTLFERAVAVHEARTLSGLRPREFAARYNINETVLSTYKALANAKGPTKLALEHGLLRDAAAARFFQQLPHDLQQALIATASEEETSLTRVQLQRALAQVEAADESRKKAAPAKAPEAPREPPSNERKGSAPAAISAGPVLEVETLLWLQNHLQELDAGTDDALRLDALEVFTQAVLRDAAVIVIRESLPVSGARPSRAEAAKGADA